MISGARSRQRGCARALPRAEQERCGNASGPRWQALAAVSSRTLNGGPYDDKPRLAEKPSESDLASDDGERLLQSKGRVSTWHGR